jgi:hypothetical protein
LAAAFAAGLAAAFAAGFAATAFLAATGFSAAALAAGFAAVFLAAVAICVLLISAMRKYATRFEPVQPVCLVGRIIHRRTLASASMNPAPAELLQLLKSAALQLSSSPTT